MMQHIIPKPNGEMHYIQGDYYGMPEQFCVDLDGFSDWCVQAFCERTGYAWNPQQPGDGMPWLCLKKREDLASEAYVLQIATDGIEVEASTEIGVIWALTTLIQIMGGERKPALCSVSDEPKYGYRGLNLDCARHYFPVETVKQVIEQISLTKMNVLHWHLADDQSWRIESHTFPKLHQTSGKYYTQEEIREIVEYARIRGVEVIPEIDLPGHTTGILAVYPEYGCFGKEVSLATGGGIFPIILCAGKESVFQFLEQLLDEICPLFPSTRFHVGGDEAPKSEWKKCPDCQRRMQEEGLANEEDLQGYFTKRVAEILKKQNKNILCWNDSLKASNLQEDVLIQYWRLQHEESMKQYYNKGGKFIYSEMFDLYLDYPHSMIPLKRVYTCEPKIGKISCANAPGLEGMECCMWTEHVCDPEQLGRRLFPRVFALAEAAWTKEQDYSDFLRRLPILLTDLERKDITYTTEDWWDPKGKKRREEALDYMEKMFSGMDVSVQQETTGSMSINLGFLKGFLTKFLRVSDLPYLGKVLKR